MRILAFAGKNAHPTIGQNKFNIAKNILRRYIIIKNISGGTGRLAARPHDLKERIESRKGLRQLSYMKEMKMGSDQYELIMV